MEKLDPDEIKYLSWRKGFVKQHQLSKVKKIIEDVFDFKEIKFGDIKKRQGDVVLIGLKDNEHVNFKEYMEYLFSIDRIETKGMYTNIFFGRKYYELMLDEIIYGNDRTT